MQISSVHRVCHFNVVEAAESVSKLGGAKQLLAIAYDVSFYLLDDPSSRRSPHTLCYSVGQFLELHILELDNGAREATQLGGPSALSHFRAA
jgi:hypothetical protein